MKTLAKTLTVIALAFACCYAHAQVVWDGVTIAEGFAQGIGTKSSPYLITTAPELVYFLRSVNNGNTYSGKYIKLNNEISMNSNNLGYNNSIGVFDGVLDGDNHFINSLSNYDYLFGELNGTICNLGFESSNLSGFGALVRTVNTTGSIISCFHILKKPNNGGYRSYPVRKGFVENNNGEIINCKISGVINTTNEYGYNYYSAGIAVNNNYYGKILHCNLDDFSFNSSGVIKNPTKKAVSNNQGIIDYGDLGPGYNSTNNKPITNTDDDYNEWVNNHSGINFTLPSQSANKIVYIKDSYGIIEEETIIVPNGAKLSSYKSNPVIEDCIFAGWNISGTDYAPNSSIVVDDNMIINATWSQLIVSQPTPLNLTVSVSDTKHAIFQWYAVDGILNTYPDWTSPSTGHDETSSYTYNIIGSEGQIIAFDWETSSESCDMLIVKVDGVKILNVGGVNRNGHQEYSLPTSGNHEIITFFSRDDSDGGGQNKVWVRNLTLSNPSYQIEGQTDNVLFKQNAPINGFVWCEISYSNSDNKLITNKIEIDRSPNYVYAKPQYLKAGENFVIPIYMNNEETIANFQFDMILPDGFSIDYSDNEYNIIKGERSSVNHTVSCSELSDSKYRILCTSTSNSSFDDTDKTLPVMYITLVADENVGLGEHLLYFNDIVLNAYNSDNITKAFSTDIWIVKTEVTTFWKIEANALENNFGRVDIDGDKIRISENGVEAASNSTISLSASPESFYRFSYWEENGKVLSYNNPLSIKINKDRTINAVFVYDAYTIDFVVDGISYYTDVQRHNDVIKVPEEAPYKEGYSFVGWRGIDSGTTVPDHDASFEAVFRINQYNVTFSANGNAIMTKKLNYGAAISIPEAPTIDDYVFISWGEVDPTVPSHDVEYIAEYALLGDLYEDNKLNVADLTSLVGLIMTEPENISSREMKIGNVFKDNTINVSDYTSLVGIILNTPIVLAAQSRDNQHFLPKMEISANELRDDNAIDLIVKLDQPQEVSALQFDMILPPEVYYDIDNLISLNGFANHSLSYSYMKDGRIRVIIYSSSNEKFTSQDNLAIRLRYDKSINNTTNILINNIIGSSFNYEIRLDELSVPVMLSNTTSLETFEYQKDLIVSIVNGTVTLESNKDQDVVIQSINGSYGRTIHISEKGRVTIGLPRGYYIINGLIYYIH